MTWLVTPVIVGLPGFGFEPGLTAERVLPTVNGVHKALSHHFLAAVLWEFNHEHTGLSANVASIWVACEQTTTKVYKF